MASLLLLLPLLCTFMFVTPSSGSSPRSGSAALFPQEEQGGLQLTKSLPNEKRNLRNYAQLLPLVTTPPYSKILWLTVVGWSENFDDHKQLYTQPVSTYGASDN